MKKNQAKRKKNLEILVFLILALLVISACYPSISPYLRINQFIVDDDHIYLIASNEEGWDHACIEQRCLHFLMSNNSGKDWSSISYLEFEFQGKVKAEPSLNKIECVSGNESICYKIDGNENVQISIDGGNTWEIDWRIPIGRRWYMEPANLWDAILPEYPMDDVSEFTPRDLITISENDTHIVFVAMGTEGLLIKGIDGGWIRRGVIIEGDVRRYASPSSYKATSLLDLSDRIGLEIILSIFLAAILAIVLYTGGKREFKSEFDFQDEILSEALDRLMEITIGASSITICCSWILISLWGFGFIPIYGIAFALTILFTILIIKKWVEKKNQIVEKITKAD